MENIQTSQKIVIRQLLKEAYTFVSQSPVLFVKLVLGLGALGLASLLGWAGLFVALPNFLIESMGVQLPLPLAIIGILIAVLVALSLVFLCMWVSFKASFAYIDSKPILIKELLPKQADWKFFPSYLLLAFVMGLIFLLSFVAFLIPFFFVYASLWPVFMKAFEEKDFSLSQITKTRNLMKGKKMAIWKLIFVIGLLSIPTSILSQVLVDVPVLNVLTALFDVCVNVALYILPVFLYRKLFPAKN